MKVEDRQKEVIFCSIFCCAFTFLIILMNNIYFNSIHYSTVGYFIIYCIMFYNDAYVI